MITLYGMGSPNVVKIYIALEELGLDYAVVPVDVFTGKQFDAEFTRLNPMAKVPVIVEVMTDNHNRSAGDLRVLFKKGQ